MKPILPRTGAHAQAASSRRSLNLPPDQNPARAFRLVWLARLAAGGCVCAETIWLSSLDLSKVQRGWGRAQADRAVAGQPLSIAGERFDRGVGTPAQSPLWIELAGGAGWRVNYPTAAWFCGGWPRGEECPDLPPMPDLEQACAMNPPANIPPAAALSRRDFLQRSTGVAALATTAATRAPAPRPTPRLPAGPNSKIHLGLIGCGGMGRVNLKNCAQYPDVVVTAACDVWARRRESVVAQFKDTCRPYSDYREVLARPDVDAVIIATPPHWHALQAIAACEAGKDIYLQKPMTLHLGESLAVRNAVKRHGIISQIGTQIHASDNYRRVVEYIRSGNLGRIGVARTFNVLNQSPDGIGRAQPTPVPDGLDWDWWCGPAPRCEFNPTLATDAYYHSSWLAYSGGWTPGMAPHIIDLPVWALDLGYPTVTSSAGGRYVLRDDGDAYDHHEVLWQYPGFTLTWMLSLTNSYDFLMKSQPPERRLGIYFHGENGTLYANYDLFRLLAEGDRLKGKEPPPVSIPPSPGHEREWLECIKSRRQPSCSVFYHVRVDVPIVLSLLSLRLGRAIRFDPATERIVGDREAAELAVPRYRAPWKFPREYLKA